VDYQIIRNLTDTLLVEVFHRLLKAEADSSGLDPSKVFVNSESKARDGGCDAWSPKPPTASPWLGNCDTCWQLRAGTAGQPSKLKGEVAKPEPKRTLAAGGRFVVVTSSCVDGKSGRDARLEILRAEAKRQGLSDRRIDVFTSDLLSNWLDKYPAISLALRGLHGYDTLAHWAKDVRHREGWFPTPALSKLASQLRQALTPSGQSHVHVWGRPGVGKTRFVLEVCKAASWADSVLYIPRPTEVSVLQVLAAATEARATLVLVVDNAPPNLLGDWGAQAHRSNGLVRLVTIGHEGALDPSNLTELSLEPLERGEMLAAVKAWHPKMPLEQHHFITDFSDGYVGLAKLTGDALSKDPSLNASDLFSRHEISALMTALLGSSVERRKLQVVAVLSSVGWERQQAQEGKTVAEHLGFSWDEVRAAVRDFDTHLGVAPLAGNLRYISPVPLGVYLAIEAWETYPDKMETLANALPTEAAKRAYYDRLQAVLASPSAKEFAQEQLGPFISWDKFVDESDVERWAAISRADPLVATQQVRRALERATRDQRLQIKGKARRHLVNALADLAWGSSTFVDAVLALAALAEAENETWTNNATGGFRSLYQLYLGGTAAPYVDRLVALDVLLERAEHSYWELVVEALSQVGRSQSFRSAPSSRTDIAREPEWQPRNDSEYVAAIESALDRLCRVAKAGRPELRASLKKAAEMLRGRLRQRETREKVAAFMRVSVSAYPDLKREFRQDLHYLLDLAQKHWKELTSDDISWLKALFVEFEDISPEGRLREVVGLRDLEFDTARLEPVAAELQAVSGLLESQWSWLTSGDAVQAWELGATLARHDPDLTFLPRLLAATPRGPDVRLVAGYLRDVVERKGPDWLDDLLDEWIDHVPPELTLAAELSWRCSPTDRSAARVQRLAKEGTLPVSLARQLTFGGWCLNLSASAFDGLLRSLSTREEYREAALLLAHQRLSKMNTEWAALESVVLTLLSDARLFKLSNMTEYAWLELARTVARGHASTFASILFAAHADKGEQSWFIEYSQMSAILSMCVEADPSAVWEKLCPYLEEPSTAVVFTIGFPGAILERLPHEAILDWVKHAPEYRALSIARLVASNLTRGSLGEKLLASYADMESVGQEYFSAWVSGQWSGSTSAHWANLSERLRGIAKTTSHRAVSEWAAGAAVSMTNMATQERKREAEESVRWH
jgi:hypothetical protein